MAIRYRSATPGVLLLAAATALLAVVSFNTPLLKSLYFLEATYSSGDYAGTLKLGTLGFCLEVSGSQNCTGPTVGYEFNPNALLGVTVFSIPEAITKYLTYTLVIHIVALACAAASLIFGLLSFISSLALLCFPTCTASMASGFSLLALVLDLVIFYIAKTRIDDVDGASASIGSCVWLTLAARIRHTLNKLRNLCLLRMMQSTEHRLSSKHLLVKLKNFDNRLSGGEHRRGKRSECNRSSQAPTPNPNP